MVPSGLGTESMEWAEVNATLCTTPCGAIDAIRSHRNAQINHLDAPAPNLRGSQYYCGSPM